MLLVELFLPPLRLITLVFVFDVVVVVGGGGGVVVVFVFVVVVLVVVVLCYCGIVTPDRYENIVVIGKHSFGRMCWVRMSSMQK